MSETVTVQEPPQGDPPHPYHLRSAAAVL